MKPSVRSLTLAAAIGLLCTATPATSRAQKLYVASDFSDTVSEYNATTGEPINPSLITGLSDPQNLAFSSRSLYVTNLIISRFWMVGEYNATTGATINASLTTGLNRSQGLAVSGGNLYVSSSNTVGEYSAATGAAINASLITGSKPPGDLAVSGGKLYVIFVSGTGSASYVGEYNATTGRTINGSLITGLVEPKGLAVSGGKLYVGSDFFDTVGEYDATTGKPINAPLTTGSFQPQSLAVSGGNLYVLYLSGSSAGSFVSKYDATTGETVNASLVTGLVNPSSMAVSPSPPIISSTLSATGTNGLAFRYRITASNNPFGFDASRLPKGLSVNTSTGLISGKPAVSGTFAVAIRATNAAGTGSGTLSLMVITPPVPVISSTLSVTGTSGLAFRYQITASNVPTRFGAADLPGDLSVNKLTGLISGKPAATGTFTATISAANAGGTDSEPLTLTILRAPPAITSGLRAVATNGLAFKYQIAASHGPVSFNATGLPGGMGVNSSTGLISGTAAMNGRFPVTISATNAGGTGSARLIVTVDYNGLRGSYAGLAMAGGTTAGFFTVSLTPGGGFTGKLTLGGAHYSLKGTFSSTRTFSGTLRTGGASLAVVLAVDPSPPGISGTTAVTTPGGVNIYSVESGLLGKFKASTIPPGLTGRYTAIIPGVSGTDPALPHAPGYGTMTVAATGAMQIAGKLGDGTAFSARGQLHADGKTYTLFSPLYGGKHPGSIAGSVTFNDTTDSDWKGVLDWIKPAQAGGAHYPDGFSLGVDLMAAKYAPPPLPPGPATFTLGGGDLPDSAITDTLTISTTSKVTVSGVNQGRITLTLKTGTGAFGGNFVDPGTGRQTPFSGVIYQKPAAAGFGLFLGTDQSGGVDIAQ